MIEWVASRLGLAADVFEPATAIGIVEGERLIAGVVYHGYRPDPGAIEASLASVSPRWCTRAVLRAIFAYPFEQLRVRRLQAVVERKDRHTRDIVMRLGFKYEGIARRFLPGAKDAAVYSMLQGECRWIAAKGRTA